MDPRPAPALGATKDLKSVVCSNLHPDLNKRSILVNHFSQFGEIDGITCSKAGKYAIIVFSTPAGAKAAREKGSVIDRNFAPVELYLSAKTASGVKQKGRLPSVTDLSTRKRFSLDRRAENQARPTAKVAMNFLQSNVRSYLNPAAPDISESSTTRDTETGGTDKQQQSSSMSAKTRLNRFNFMLPAASTASSQPKTEPEPDDDEPEETESQESEPDTKPVFSAPAPFSIQTTKPFTFKSNEREKTLSGSVSMEEEFTSIKSERSEPQDSPLALPTTDSGLHELLCKRAKTAEDRYRILDARDKLLRMKNPKVKVRVEFAVRLTGTCPDMCPEKERYMREFQRQLKDYECLSPTGEAEVDHRKAIKQYSRSSADQEEPLPHELRPIETLDMTMNYLLHNIVNRSEIPNENLLEWYGFMWDRTRSIRKDITQQQLCDVKSVALMETCTRFHIHCSTRLCELDRHAFDPKLNDENLMKCLQSLEHMYGDLHVKGVQCPNEPEFRSYQILMNLNEGDILWEIQQKPISILRSVEVQHALKIHLALSQKNFVAFFRLVRNSSYMTSCILHRYFYQVRSFALRRLIRAHSIPNMQSAIPASTLQKLLGFGLNEGILLKEFCDAHGIHCDVANRTILLNRRRIINPDAPLMHRERSLIESKLNVTVAEAIKGEELGLNPVFSYNPHSSFDAQGYLLKSDEIFTKLNRKTERLMPPPPAMSIRRSPEKQVSNAAVSLPSSGAVFGNLPQSTVPIFGKPATASPFGFAPTGVFGSTNLTASGFNAAPTSLASGPPPAFQTFPTTSSTSIFPGAQTITSTNAFGPSDPSVVSRNLFSGPAFGSGGSGPKLFRFAPPAAAAQLPAPVENQEDKFYSQFEENYKQPVYNSVVNKAISEEAPAICAETLRQLKEEARIEEQWRGVEQQITQQLKEQIEGRSVSALVTDICSSELSQARTLKSILEEIREQLLNTVAQDLVREISSERHGHFKIERENNIKLATRLLARVQLSFWVQHWKRKASSKKLERLRLAHKRRSDRENFPPSVSYALSPASILSMLRSPYPVRLKKTLNVAESVGTISRVTRLLSRVQLSVLLQRWRRKAAEKKFERLQLSHKRRSDIENFPPCLSYKLSPATILSSWCMMKSPSARPSNAAEANAKSPKMFTPTHSTQLPPPRGKRSLSAADDTDAASAGSKRQAKSSRKQQDPFLADIYAFIHEVKQEKESLLQNQ